MTDDSPSVRFGVTLPRRLYSRMCEAAGADGVRLGEWLRQAILEKLRRDASS